MGISVLTLALARKGKSSSGGGSGQLVDLTKKLLLRTLSGEFNENTLSEIGMYALSYCHSLTKIVMPKCKTIANGAFRNCDGVASALFEIANFVGSNSFTDCHALQSITIGGSGEHVIIESSAFVNCYHLSAVILPFDSVCVLENVNAFSRTPIADTSYIGSYGAIYVPQALVNEYKSATNWSVYADRIVGIS